MEAFALSLLALLAIDLLAYPVRLLVWLIRKFL